MSYNGTVRCSYCHEKGHNRLGCPHRRKEALKNPESYEGRLWHREQERRKAQVENRVCSYCKEPGHNRRGCKLLKEDKQLIRDRQDEFLDRFAQLTSSAGIGPGALVKIPQGRHSDDGGIWSKGFVGMVQKFKWENIDFLLSDIDLSRGWAQRDKPLATIRVVSPFGYPEEENHNYWNSPPKFNDVERLTVLHMHEFVPELFETTPDFGSDTTPVSARLVGPIKAQNNIPTKQRQELTPAVEKTFSLAPEKRADDWEKRRLELEHTAWQHIRPEQYKEISSFKKENRK